MEDKPSIFEDGGLRLQHPDILPEAFDIRMALQMSEIALAPPCQIINDADLITMRKQDIDHMAADETRAAGYDGKTFSCHAAFSLFNRRTL
jgi:hypothetical protein